MAVLVWSVTDMCDNPKAINRSGVYIYNSSTVEDLATGLSLSLGPMCGTLFRPKLDNRVTIYYSSRVNWKHFCSSSPEPFCGSISNEGPYKYSILLLLVVILQSVWFINGLDSIKCLLPQWVWFQKKWLTWKWSSFGRFLTVPAAAAII